MAGAQSGIALNTTSSTHAPVRVEAGTSVGASVATGSAGSTGASVAAGVAWAHADKIMLATTRKPKTVISFFMINLLHQNVLVFSCSLLKSNNSALGNHLLRFSNRDATITHQIYL
jgi:hypothetical protein